MTVRPTPADRPLAIRLRGIVKRYGEITAVDRLDLDVPEGTCVGLLGPNGAGKSTTMKLLTAQAIADEGQLEVLGYPLPRRFEAGDAHAACRRDEDPRQHLHRRRLARAVRAEEAVDLAGRDLEVDAVDRARALLELADEPLGLDRVRHGRPA